MSKELDDMNNKAAETYKREKARLREHYAYARAKGFSGQQAKALQSAAYDKIDRLAQEL